MGHGTDVAEWGHEYVRHLSMEIGAEWNAREDAAAALDQTPGLSDLEALVRQIVPYHCTHNAEPEAVDLLLDVRPLTSSKFPSYKGELKNSSSNCQVLEKLLSSTCCYLDVCLYAGGGDCERLAGGPR